MYSPFGGGAAPSSSSPNLFIMEGSAFAGGMAPARTLLVRSVCAFCEGSWQVPVGTLKSEEQKALEEIAADHFKRRVLRAEETLLEDTGSIAEDIERCCQLLNSVVLCDGCVSRFCSSEAKVLKAQLDYLEKMTGPREFGDMLADPWLDLKRFAYAKLKSQQPSISEKLRLIQQLVPNEAGSTISASGSRRSSTIERESSGTGTTTGTGSVLLNIPQLPGQGDPISVDVQFPPICQFTVPSEASNSSSTAHSPNDHHNNDHNEKEDLASALTSPSGYETANDEQESTMHVDNNIATTASTNDDNSSKSVTKKGEAESETMMDSNQASGSNPVGPTPKPRNGGEKVDQAESATEDEESDTDDSDNTVDISSITASAPPAPRSRKTPGPGRAKKNLDETDTPSVKRAKLDLSAISTGYTVNSATSTPKGPPSGVVYAKKSTPVPASPLVKVKGKPSAASTPKDDPKNKGSRKSVAAAASEAYKPGKVTEKDKPGLKNDKKSTPNSSGFSTPTTPASKSPKKVLKVGGRVFTETSCSSSDSDSD